MSKKSYYVIPSTGGGWSVRKSGAEKSSRIFEKKSDAEHYARQIARENRSDVYVHRRDGTISEKNSYGSDPRPPKG